MRTRTMFRKILGFKTCSKCGRSEDDIEEAMKQLDYTQEFIDSIKDSFLPFHEIKKGADFDMFHPATEKQKQKYGFDEFLDAYKAKEDFILCDRCWSILMYQLDDGWKKCDFRRFLRKK